MTRGSTIFNIEFGRRTDLYETILAQFPRYTLTHLSLYETQTVSGRFLGIIRINPRVFKSNRLYVVIFQFFFTNLRYTL